MQFVESNLILKKSCSIKRKFQNCRLQKRNIAELNYYYWKLETKQSDDSHKRIVIVMQGEVY